MSIKIQVSQHVTFDVEGSIRNADGTPEDFAFRLTARRLDDHALQAAQASVVDAVAREQSGQPINSRLAELVTGWYDVKDDQGEPVPFSPEALGGLLKTYAGLNMLVWRAYQGAAGVKAKN